MVFPLVLVAVVGGAEVEDALEPDGVVLAVATEFVVGVLQADMGVAGGREFEGAADIGSESPAAFEAGHAVAGRPFGAGGGDPVLGEFPAEGGVDPAQLVVAAGSGGIASLVAAEPCLGAPPGRAAREFEVLRDVGAYDPGVESAGVAAVDTPSGRLAIFTAWNATAVSGTARISPISPATTPPNAVARSTARGDRVTQWAVIFGCTMFSIVFCTSRTIANTINAEEIPPSASARRTANAPATNAPMYGM